MRSWSNQQQTREQWIEQRLSVVKVRGDEYVCRCVFCTDESGNLWVNPVRGLYHCWRGSCGASGTFFRLVRHVEGAGSPTRWHQLQDRFGRGWEREGLSTPVFLGGSKPGGHREKPYPFPTLPPGFQRLQGGSPRSLVGKRVWDYLRGRGVSLPVLEQYGVGYSPEPRWAFRAILPVWGQGQSLGFTSRHIGNREPKYWTAPSLQVGVFGVEGPEEVIVRRGEPRLLFVEGPFDVLRAPEPAIAGLGVPVSSLRFEQNGRMEQRAGMEESRLSVLLCQLEPKELVFVLDSDTTWEQLQPLVNSVAPFIPVVYRGRPIGKDVGESGAYEIVEQV